MATRPFIGAVVISQEYGTPNPGSRRGYHTGVDYSMPVGKPVIAPENGVIVQNGDGRAAADGRGFFITMKGDSGVGFCLYHLQKMGTVTGRVTEGQVIGYSGNTGNSTGPHLHFETRKDVNNNTSDFPPAQWLFATPAPQPNPVPPAAKQYVRVFGDYRTLYKGVGTGAFQRIAPNNYGGSLDYEVLERSGNFVRIQTQMYGQAWIYVGPDVASLTQFYSK